MLPARMTARRLLALLAAAALLPAAAGCGNKKDRITSARTEGIFVNVGPLDYQVQISRLLNPGDLEDRGYLRGLGPGVTAPTGKESWFAVFLRVENNGEHSAPSASEFDIEDTQGARYDPVAIQPSNVFAYRAGVVPAHEVRPAASTAAADAPVGGSLVLFKIKLSSLENRPLDFHIHDPSAPEQRGTVELDV
jgi:hypothetical protein